MKSLGAFILLVASAGCAVPRPTEGLSSAWLAGTWLMTSNGERDLTACASGLPIHYGADGAYTIFEESGRWRLDGAMLTETATEAHEDIVDPAEVAIGKPFESRIRRLNRDSFIKTYSDGRQEVFRRCPSAR